MPRIVLLLLGVLVLSIGAYVFFEKEILTVAGSGLKILVSGSFWSKSLIVLKVWLGKMSWRFFLVELPKKLFLPLAFITAFNSKNRKFMRRKLKSLKDTARAIKRFTTTRLESIFGKRTSLAIALIISVGVFGIFFIAFGAYMIVWTGKMAVPGFIMTAWRWVAGFTLSLLQRLGFKTTIFVSAGTAWEKWVHPFLPAPSKWWKKIRHRSARRAIRARQFLGIKSHAARNKIKLLKRQRKEGECKETQSLEPSVNTALDQVLLKKHK